MPVTRETLYREVWAEPMTSVAKRYGVSSSFLARVRDRLNVPKPARGHWVRLQFGKQAAQPSLPPAQPGEETEWSRDGVPPRVPRQPPTAPLPSPASAAPTTTNARRTTRHALITSAAGHFQKLRQTKGEYLKPCKMLLADIFVSQATLERAFGFATRLYLALESRGHRVVIAPHGERLDRDGLEHRRPVPEEEPFSWISDRWRPARTTVTYIGTVAVGLTVFELAELTEVKYSLDQRRYIRWNSIPPEERKRPWGESKPDTAYMPSGKLAIRIYSPYRGEAWHREWEEGRARELPSKIDEIVGAIETGAPVIADLVREEIIRRDEMERKWAIEAKKREEREADARRAEALKASREDLEQIIREWASARSLTDFFAQVKREAEALETEERETMLARLEEARALFGGAAVLEQFRSWRSPREQ